jgi:GNAT superfamily N-acetyltransferase
MTTAVSHSLDLIRDDYDLSKFCCGERDLDKIINKKLKKYHQRNTTKVFCATLRGSATVYGLYTLSIRSEDAKLLLEGARVPEKHFPAIYIGTLAVARHRQGNGLGKILLVNALRRAYFVAQHVAVFGVALHSLNDRTTKFYARYGFGLRDKSATPLMVLPVWSLNDLFERKAQDPHP